MLIEPNIGLAGVRPLDQEHAEDMTDRDDFLAWVRTALYEAEPALHNGAPPLAGRFGRVTSS